MERSIPNSGIRSFSTAFHNCGMHIVVLPWALLTVFSWLLDLTFHFQTTLHTPSELAPKTDSAPSQVKYSDLLNWASELNDRNAVQEAVESAVNEYSLGERRLIAKVWAFRQTLIYKKLGYPNFRVFAEAEFGSTLSTSRVYQWMSAFDVMSALNIPWNAPVRESVLRPLTCSACMEDRDLLERAWKKACEASVGRAYPTAAQVDAALTSIVGTQPVLEPAEEVDEVAAEQVAATEDEPIEVEAVEVHTSDQECATVLENSDTPDDYRPVKATGAHLMQSWQTIADFVDWDAVAFKDESLTRESFTSELNSFWRFYQ